MSSSSGNFPLTFKLQVQGDAEIVNKFKTITAAMNQINPAAAKTAQSVKQAETSMKTVVTAAGSAATSLTNMSAKAREMGTSLSTASASTTAASTSMTTVGTSAGGAATSLTDMSVKAREASMQTGTLGTESTKTRSGVQKLTDVFQGNKGLIFSVTMLSSGIFEAIGMYQGWQDASEKLAAAKEKEADLIARGLEGTKEYGDAVNEVADAQRGYNFITRFTIQSFADLIPMSLMLTSSLLGMVSSAGGLTNAKTKLAAAGTKLVGVLQSVGTALMALSTGNKILLLLGLIATAVVALIKNWGGFRDAVNGLGVELGNLIAPLKGILDSYLTFGGEATAATNDVEKAVMKTGDATSLSFNEQMVLMGKLGEEAGEMAFSVGTHLKQQEKAEAAHNEKYKQFVEAMTSGNEDIQKSLGLTNAEFADFSKQMQDEMDALDEKWNTGVENIMSNWDAVTSGFGDSVGSTVGEIVKLEDKITELTNQQWELDDKKALQKNREEIAKNQAKIDELRGTATTAFGDMSSLVAIFGSDVQTMAATKITPSMEQAGKDFMELGKAAADGLNAIRLGILSQDFDSAVKTLTTALDGVPERYKGNFTEIDAILGNSALTQRQKIAQIVADYGSLENAAKPLIVGAYELSRSNALVASSLDEVAVAARSHMTGVDQAKGAWDKFINALGPAQKNLPIITDLQARLAAGTITHAEALKEAEAAGREWSQVMGEDVATSIKNVQKSFIDMGDGTSQMVGQINGQMVNLGRVSNTELGNLSDDAGVATAAMSKTGETATQSLENEATTALGIMGKDGQFHFGTVVKGANNTIDVFKAVNLYADRYVAQGATAKIAGLATEMETTGSTVTTETESWNTSFEGFATAVAGAFKTIKDALNTPIDLGAAATAIVDSLTTALTKEFPKLLDQGAELVGQIAKGIIDFAKTVQPAAEATIAHFVTGTQKKYQEIVTVGGAIVEQVSKGIMDFAKLVGPSGEAVVNNFVTGVQKVAKTVLDAGKGLVEQIGSGIEALFPQLKTKGNASTTAFRDGIVAKVSLILDAGKGIMSAVITGINTLAEKLKTTITAPFEQAKTFVENLFKGWDPLGALSGVGAELLKILRGGGIQGVEASKGDGKGVTLDQANKMMDAGFGGLSQSSSQKDIKAAQAQWSNFSTSMQAYATSITAAITKIQTAFSTLSTSVATYAKSMTATVAAWITANTTAIGAFLAPITLVQQKFSTLSTSIATYTNSMKINVGTFISTSNTQLASMTAAIIGPQTAWSTFSTSVATYTSSMGANILAFVTATITQLGEIVNTVLLTQGTFSTFSTSIATYMTSMSANVAAWGIATITAFTEVSKIVLTTQGVYSKFSTSVATYMTSMKTNTASWGTSSITALSNVSKNILTTQGTASKFSTSWSTYMKSMTAAVKSFASTTVSELKKVVSAANAATSALNKMAAAAKKAAAARASVGGMEHGGSFIAHAQKGFSGIVDTPTTFKGVRMGEGFAPELVTVQPLTRGTGNTHAPTVSSGGKGGGDSRPIEIHLHNELGGREVQRVIKKVALDDISLQI
jgi:hypothetical protein